MELHTPKREPRGLGEALPCSPPMCDTMLYPWNWSEEARNVNLSPGSSCSSPEYRENSVVATRTGGRSHNAASESHRRGRPRADALSNLMMQGSTSPSNIKCSYCNRVFPREKSLQAHLRTHTGERPYPCDYPGCTKAFTQSGQLKTHQRLHTGEKPFLCTEPGCEMRFTHANRHCPDHPYATLTRSDDFVLKPVSENTELPHDVTRWLERYKMSREREDRTPTGKNERKKKTWKGTAENHKRIKSRKGLMMDAAGEQENLDRKPPNQRLYCGESQDSQEESQDEDPVCDEACTALPTSEDEESLTAKSAVSPLRRPLDRLQPKKRWLREACLEQQLAKPLNWDTRTANTALNSLTKPNENHHTYDSTNNSQLEWSISPNKITSITSNSASCFVNDNDAAYSKSQDSFMLNQGTWDANMSSEKDAALQVNWHRGNVLEMENSSSDSQRFDTDVDPVIRKMQIPGVSRNLYWNSSSVIDSNNCSMPTAQMESKIKQLSSKVSVEDSMNSCISENETRPTVLMLAGSGNNHNNNREIAKVSHEETDKAGVKVIVLKQDEGTNLPHLPEDNQKWLGALALMELAKTQEEAAKALNFKRENEENVAQAGLNYTHL